MDKVVIITIISNSASQLEQVINEFPSTTLVLIS